MNIQLQRNKLIEQIQLINDIDLLKTIKSLLDYSNKKQNDFEVPEWQQDAVLKRINKLKQNPKLIISREELNKRVSLFIHK